MNAIPKPVPYCNLSKSIPLILVAFAKPIMKPMVNENTKIIEKIPSINCFFVPKRPFFRTNEHLARFLTKPHVAWAGHPCYHFSNL